MASQSSRRRRETQSKDRVGRLTRELQQMKDGVYQPGSSEILQRKLLPIDYKALLDSFELNSELAGYIYDKIRYEYRPSTKGKAQFSVYRNDPFHNGMVENISGHVRLWLNDLIHRRVEGIPTGRDGKRIVEIARNIKSLGTTPITFDETQIHPDCSYRYGSAADTQYPNMVVEVAWSQHAAKLRDRARELIHKSGGDIRTVVGLNFHGTWKIWKKLKHQLGNPKMPARGPVDTIVFRASFDPVTGQTILDTDGQPMVTETYRMFCNEHGKVDLGQQLRLELEDFLPEVVLRKDIKGKALRSVELILDSPTLMRYYDELLMDQKALEDHNKSEKSEKTSKKRKRETKD
ncbi:hypothetical protein GGR58DRAFT_519626 [Xylaria digitata]|nr:hypothetical protein GGR58DRAFT_519626 [Xylaria digitata]